MSELHRELAQAQAELDREPEEPLQLLETAIPLPDEEQPTEAPKRRRYQRKARDTVEDATSSSDTPGAQPRRRYVPRAKAPEKVLEAQEEQIEAMLTTMFIMAGTPASFIFPVTGTTMVLRAQQGAHALIEAGKANPRIAAIILAMVKGGHYGPLVMFGLTMLTAAAVDIGAVPPGSPPAQMLLKDVLVNFKQTPADLNGHAAQASGETNA